jgi:hypothetical protein
MKIRQEHELPESIEQWGWKDLKVLTEPNSPAAGIKVAMIEHNGAPIELIEFEKNNITNRNIMNTLQ